MGAAAGPAARPGAPMRMVRDGAPRRHCHWRARCQGDTTRSGRSEARLAGGRAPAPTPRLPARPWRLWRIVSLICVCRKRLGPGAAAFDSASGWMASRKNPSVSDAARAATGRRQVYWLDDVNRPDARGEPGVGGRRPLRFWPATWCVLDDRPVHETTFQGNCKEVMPSYKVSVPTKVFSCLKPTPLPPAILCCIHRPARRGLRRPFSLRGRACGRSSSRCDLIYMRNNRPRRKLGPLACMASA
jgi:hypothetical protein